MKFNIYTWTTLVFLILTVFGAINVLVCIFTFHLTKGIVYAGLTALLGYIFKFNLDRFTEVEQSSDR